MNIKEILIVCALVIVGTVGGYVVGNNGDATVGGSTNATFTAANLISEGDLTTNGKLCVYNGASYSIISFASNSTTVVTATSTTCE